jgi:hypothetical protein
MLCLTQQHACKTFLIYVDKYLAIQFKCMRHFVHTHFDEISQVKNDNNSYLKE